MRPQLWSGLIRAVDENLEAIVAGTARAINIRFSSEPCGHLKKRSSSSLSAFIAIFCEQLRYCSVSTIDDKIARDGSHDHVTSGALPIARY